MAAAPHSPNDRSAALRRGAAAFALCLLGCAHQAPPEVAAAGPTRDDAHLRAQLAERDRRIAELESRMALLEAEARNIRERLAAPPVTGLRRTVRIGSHVRDAESAEATESRPVLRLHGTAPRAAAGASAVHTASRREPLPPLPEAPDERLPIAPLPSASVESLERTPDDPVAAYRAGLDLVRRRDFDRALAALSAFLVRYPGDTRTADVLYWRGEVQFALSDFEGALASFHGSLETRPAGERAPDALLKVGLCHRELGAPAQARSALERLKAQFPQSRAAKLVSQEDAS